MKKTLFYISIAFVVLGCSKTESLIEQNVPRADIKIYARDLNSHISKTVTDSDSYQVEWADGDNVAVFTSVAGSLPLDYSSWCVGNPVKFTTDSEEGGNRVFLIDESLTDATKLTAFRSRYEDNAALDWYVVYPGLMSTPSHPGKSVIFFGKRSDLDMSQHGNDNTGHLSRHDVLFGKALNTLEPVVTMQHIGALQQVTVTNNSADEITVKSIAMTTTSAKLSGEFRLHLADETVFDPSDAMSSSNEYVLDVTDGTPIPSGASAKFYFVTAPFKVAAGEMVSFQISTDKGVCAKNMTASSEMSFLSGHRYNANISFKLEEAKAKQVNDLVMNVYKMQLEGCNSGLDLTNGEVIDLYNISAADQARVDVVTFQPSTIVFAAPSNNDHFAWLQGAAFTAIPSWKTRNTTSFRKTWMGEAAFRAITKYSEIVDAYDKADASWTINGVSGSESQNKFMGLKGAQAGYLVIAAKTSDGRYALIYFKTVGAYVEDPAWSNMTITIDVKIKDTETSQE